MAEARKSASTCTLPGNRVEWLIDNAEAYGALLESLHAARKSVHIAQLAFDADCAAYSSGSPEPLSSREAVIAETLMDLAAGDGPEIRIVLNATWILDTARPLRKFFAGRGLSPDRIQVRGLSRFPHFMHAKLVLIDGRDAFLLGSPFVNSYWDDGGHIPFDARRPLRELGGRPLHDVSVRLYGPIVHDLEAMFAGVWDACERDPHDEAAPVGPSAPAATQLRTAPESGIRIVRDAPDRTIPLVPDGATCMLDQLLDAIARARFAIYIEHQYLTSRPIVAALADALRRAPALEIVIVLNQNPDLTAYRAWQNAQLEEHALLSHARVGVFTLWSTDTEPARPAVTRINQLFIHSKVMVIDDEWAAVGTSNLDGVSMGDYGADFASSLGRRIFRGVRNVEVNLVIDARDGGARNAGAHADHAREVDARDVEDARGVDGRARDIESIIELRERLWSEHLGASREALRERATHGWVAMWRAAARANVAALRLQSKARPSCMSGRALPYSTRAYPRDQLRELGIELAADVLELCYNPTWIGVFASPHWIRNIF